MVVGGAIAVVLWLTVSELPQPATDDDETDRADAQTGTKAASEPAAGSALPAEPEKDLETADPGIDGLESVPHEKESELGSAQAARPATVRQMRTAPVLVDAPAGPGREGQIKVSWPRRARSGVSLVIIMVVVGFGVAAVVGTVAVMISRALESAVK